MQPPETWNHGNILNTPYNHKKITILNEMPRKLGVWIMIKKKDLNVYNEIVT